MATRGICIKADTHEVVIAELTPDDVGDVSTVTKLLEQIASRVASLTADGAYDGEAVYDAVAERHPGAAIIIPPRATEIANEAATSQRDGHTAMIAQHGRLGWQRRSGYNRRSLVETAVFRYKTIIGQRLCARSLLNQRTEAKIGCNVLTSCTPITASAKPHQPLLVAVASFKQAASPSA